MQGYQDFQGFQQAGFQQQGFQVNAGYPGLMVGGYTPVYSPGVQASPGVQYPQAYASPFGGNQIGQMIQSPLQSPGQMIQSPLQSPGQMIQTPPQTPVQAGAGNAVLINDRVKVEKLRQLELAKAAGWITEDIYQMGIKLILQPSPAAGAVPAGAQVKDIGAHAGIEPFSLPNTPAELVTKRWFDWNSQKWMSDNIKVQIDLSRHFSEGNLRFAYKALDLSRKTGMRAFVAKRQKDKCFDREGAFKDVEMQEECREWARKFNALNPPKKVEFVEAFLIERQAPNLPVQQRFYAMEPFMSGKYSKHNNNYGWVAKEDRNTPQAFSHFTWEKSGHRLMIVDIQGVGDSYTDPQVHTSDGKGYGAGNVGPEGIGQFLGTHKCSKICRALGLPSYNAKVYDVGTQPIRGVTGKPVPAVMKPAS